VFVKAILRKPLSTRRRSLFWGLAVIPLVLIGLWLTRAAWLPYLFQYLDVSQPPHKADFIVILGGGIERAERAAELYQQGYTSHIIVSGGKSFTRSYYDLMIEANVPHDTIIVNDRATSTWDEAEQVLAILHERNAQSALIITDSVHTRRAQATYQSLINDSSIQLTFVAAVTDLSADTWWQSRYATRYVLSEYVKIVYYFLRYGVRE
jgi:uncharacterized SAM-binding protein YcdF (DUF218 family)